MTPLTKRRDFITSTVKAGVGLYVGSSILSSCSASKQVTIPASFRTGYQQQPLPYNYSALTEAIDATTMEIHYSKHAASYATNLKDAAAAEGVNTANPLEDVLGRISKYSTKMRNNGGGHYNHELFWKLMSPNGGQPTGTLLNQINSSFGSLDAFKKQFGDAGTGRFGSGWAWLIVDAGKKLRITSTPNQDNPLMDLPSGQAGVAEQRGFPILALDVWEHAYYLRYQNKRADYIQNWWKVVNWNYVQERMNSSI